RPPAHLGKQVCDTFLLVFPLDLAIHARGIVGFVPQIPTQYAIIVAELAQYPADIVVQNPPVPAVIEMFSARALHPTGVGHSRSRRALLTRFGERIPTRVEQDKQWFDAMARRDGDKPRKTSLEAAMILGPQLIVEKDPHCIE